MAFQIKPMVLDLKPQPPSQAPSSSQSLFLLPTPSFPSHAFIFLVSVDCSNFSDAPTATIAGQNTVHAMVWGSFPNHRSDHITSLIETLQNGSPVVTAGALEPSWLNLLEEIITTQGTHTSSGCAYICMICITEVKVLWNKLTLASCDALWSILFYSSVL